MVRIVNDPNFLAWLKQRYSSRGHAIYVYTSSKYLLKIIENPLMMKQLNYRRARGVLEAVPALRDYALLMYGINLEINTKLLRKYMPPRKIEEITKSILEFEIKETGEAISIIDQALETIKKIANRNTKYKLPIILAFFTGLRSTEIKYMLDNWNTLRKIKLNGVYLVVLNYDRVKKKAYITLIPEKLFQLINEYHPILLTENWKDHVRHKFGINIGLFRKAWVAITSGYLDDGEKDLLQGRLETVQVEHYIKHIKLISQKYYEAFKPYLYLLDLFAENAEDTAH